MEKATTLELNLQYGLCICCLNKGHHKDMAQEYYWNGIREVYNDVVKDTFDIVIDTNKSIALICKICIDKLREASNFKIMLISSQQQLQGIIQDGDVHYIFETNIKDENIKEEDNVDNDDIDNVDDFDFRDQEDECSGGNECSVANNENEFVSLKERIFMKRFENVYLKPLPKKSILPKAPPLSFRRKIKSLKGKTIPTKQLTHHLTNTKTMEVISNVQLNEKNAHIHNATIILQCSNVIPFKSKNFYGYPCFYCRHSMRNSEDLREHVTSLHKNVNIRNVLWRYGAECLVVYVDVTNLTCTLCSSGIPNLNELKKHLMSVHKKEICLEYTDRIVPFKLSNENIFECQVCGFNFETFGSIERHMNTHFRNYICIVCGNGFVTKYRLKTHIKNMHSEGTHPCSICKKNFTSRQKLKNHVDSVHEMTKRFKCPNCKERFTEYFKRQKHLVQVHGATPLKYKCNVCDKIFDRRYTLSRHLKKDHLEERDFVCNLCEYRCFTKSELRVHMIKHGGERIYECKVCKKAYARKKTLKEHLRIHNNDRRFVCPVCGQAFIQKCSLKGHLKTHHPELGGVN